jgi:CubicO group peptidase (beta-lactamase class C family)
MRHEWFADRGPRHDLWAVLLLSLCGAAIAWPAEDLPLADPATLGMSGERLDRLHERLQAYVDGGLPGAVLLVARHGKVASLRAYGSLDMESRAVMRPDAIFRLASATKIVTSVALLTLHEEGRFSLRDPVADYLPEFARLTVGTSGAAAPAKRTLRIRDLLRHTTGYGYGFDEARQAVYRSAGIMRPGPDLDWSHDLTLSEWAIRLATIPMADEPGTRFDYGFGSDLAGLLIERVTGLPLDRAIEERVLKPLKMVDTGFFVPDPKIDRLTSIYGIEKGKVEALDRAARSPLRRRPKALSGGGGWDNLGNGGLVSTAPDFCRLLQMILNGGILDGVRVLAPKTVELMRLNQLADLERPDSFWPGVGFGFGYAVLYDLSKFGEIGSPGAMWWAGSTNVHFWLDPREGLIGVLMLQVRPFPYLDVMGAVRGLTWQAIDEPSGAP